MKKVLIVDEMHHSLMPMLHILGFETNYQPSIGRAQILEIIDQYEGIIIRSKTPLNQAFFEAAKSLKFVGRAGAGLDQIDLKAAEHIALLNAPEGNRDAVGEHVIGMLLCLLNHLHTADQQVRAGQWKREANRGHELKNQTVGIIGFGHNGSATAEKLSGFGCQILANDLIPEKCGQWYASLEKIQAEATIISLHVPLTDLTRNLLDTSFIDKCTHNVLIINASRGEIVVLEDLLKALKNGKVIAAGLDVLENEKLDKLSVKQKEIFDQLTQLDQVLLSPHVAGWTFESYERINQVLVEKIAKLYQ